MPDGLCAMQRRRRLKAPHQSGNPETRERRCPRANEEENVSGGACHRNADRLAGKFAALHHYAALALPE
jgi:hypothetical protein